MFLVLLLWFFFFFKQKTAYEMRISDWSSDVCSSDLFFQHAVDHADKDDDAEIGVVPAVDEHRDERRRGIALWRGDAGDDRFQRFLDADPRLGAGEHGIRSEEHTSDLQSLMRISYAVFCLKKKNRPHTNDKNMTCGVQSQHQSTN